MPCGRRQVSRDFFSSVRRTRIYFFLRSQCRLLQTDLVGKKRGEKISRNQVKPLAMSQGIQMLGAQPKPIFYLRSRMGMIEASVRYFFSIDRFRSAPRLSPCWSFSRWVGHTSMYILLISDCWIILKGRRYYDKSLDIQMFRHEKTLWRSKENSKLHEYEKSMLTYILVWRQSFQPRLANGVNNWPYMVFQLSAAALAVGGAAVAFIPGFGEIITRRLSDEGKQQFFSVGK